MQRICTNKEFSNDMLHFSPETLRTPNHGGSYAGQVTVAIHSKIADATIYYTTDGTQPTAQSLIYTGPFTLKIPSGQNTSHTIHALLLTHAQSGPVEKSITYSLSGAEDALELVRVNLKKILESIQKYAVEKNMPLAETLRQGENYLRQAAADWKNERKPRQHFDAHVLSLIKTALLPKELWPLFLEKRKYAIDTTKRDPRLADKCDNATKEEIAEEALRYAVYSFNPEKGHINPWLRAKIESGIKDFLKRPCLGKNSGWDDGKTDKIPDTDKPAQDSSSEYSDRILLLLALRGTKADLDLLNDEAILEPCDYFVAEDFLQDEEVKLLHSAAKTHRNKPLSDERMRYLKTARKFIRLLGKFDLIVSLKSYRLHVAKKPYIEYTDGNAISLKKGLGDFATEEEAFEKHYRFICELFYKNKLMDETLSVIRNPIAHIAKLYRNASSNPQ